LSGYEKKYGWFFALVFKVKEIAAGCRHLASGIESRW
jgi:hypothetical protein